MKKCLIEIKSSNLKLKLNWRITDDNNNKDFFKLLSVNRQYYKIFSNKNLWYLWNMKIKKINEIYLSGIPFRIFSVVSTVLNIVTPRPKTLKCLSHSISFRASDVKSTFSRKTVIKGSTISNVAAILGDASVGVTSLPGSFIFERSSAIFSTTKSLEKYSKRSSRQMLFYTKCR